MYIVGKSEIMTTEEYYRLRIDALEKENKKLQQYIDFVEPTNETLQNEIASINLI